MEYPILYGENETKFSNYGLYICKDAYDLRITEVLNGEYSINFKIPNTSDINKLIPTSALVGPSRISWIKCEDTIFSIDKITTHNDNTTKSYIEIEGQHIKFWARQAYVNNKQFAASKISTIVTTLLNEYLPNGRFKPSQTMIDFDVMLPADQFIYNIEFRNKNLYECLVDLAEKSGAEITCSNMPDSNGKFAIGLSLKVYSDLNEFIGGIGSSKPDIAFRKNKNIRSIKKEVDYANVVNRLFVFGKGGGSFDGHIVKFDQYARPLPQAEWISIPVGQNFIGLPVSYDEKIAYVSFPDINVKTELYWAGWSKLNELGSPRVNYNIEIVDLQYIKQIINFDAISLGDRVTYFEDNEDGTETPIILRLTEYQRYPLEPENNSVKFSTVESSIFYTFNDFWKTKVTMDQVKDSTGTKIMPDALADIVVSKENVITSDGPQYGGHIVAGAARSGLRISNSDEVGSSTLFFENDGKIYLLNSGGVGVYINVGTLATPQLRTYNGTDYIFSDIITEANLNTTLEANTTINRMKDVAHTIPLQVGMTLKWNGTQWVPSF